MWIVAASNRILIYLKFCEPKREKFEISILNTTSYTKFGKNLTELDVRLTQCEWVLKTRTILNRGWVITCSQNRTVDLHQWQNAIIKGSNTFLFRKNSSGIVEVPGLAQDLNVLDKFVLEISRIFFTLFLRCLEYWRSFLNTSEYLPNIAACYRNFRNVLACSRKIQNFPESSQIFRIILN